MLIAILIAILIASHSYTPLSSRPPVHTPAGYGNYSDNPYGQNYATGGGSGGGFMAGGGSQDSPSGKVSS